MEHRRAEEMEQEDSLWKQLRRDWCWGQSVFREEMMGLMEQAGAENHSGKEIMESLEKEAERLVADLLREVGWTQKDLGSTAKAILAR